MSSYELYRRTTLGVALCEVLEELLQGGHIGPNLEERIKFQFDKSMNDALENKVKKKVDFKGRLHTYRNCDNVWIFILERVEFKTDTGIVNCDLAKIVANDGGKGSKGAADV